jgi:hypothetical protein
MRRWWKLVLGVVLFLVVGAVVVWQLTPQPEHDDESVPEVAVEEDVESQPTPIAEDIEVLASQVESQDKEVFLDAWDADLESVVGEEAVRELLMVPEGSKVTASDPIWSDEDGGWTIAMTIETPDHGSITRTMVIGYVEGQLRILREVK